MRRHTWVRPAALAGALLGASLVFTGCAAANVADAVSAGAPDGVTMDALDPRPVAVWIEQGERFAVVTWGSSSCPAVATDLIVETTNRLLLKFAPTGGDACTADLAPTPHEFVLPGGIDGAPVTITVSFEGEVQSDELLLQ